VLDSKPILKTMFGSIPPYVISLLFVISYSFSDAAFCILPPFKFHFQEIEIHKGKIDL